MHRAYDLCLRMNKTPVRVYLGAVVDKGIAEPEEIDALLKSSGDPMGHFELTDFIGLDTVYHSSLYRATVLHSEYGPFKELEKKVKAGHLGSQDVDISVIISRLNRIAKKYNKEILKPTQLLKEKLDTCRKLNL